MEFLILGPLEARDDGRPVALGAAKQRALLAAAAPPRQRGSCSTDRGSSRTVWPGSGRDEATKALQVAVSRLRPCARQAAGADVIVDAVRRATALTSAQTGALDAAAVRARCSPTARAALAGGDPAEAASVLRRALCRCGAASLWPTSSFHDASPGRRSRGSRRCGLRPPQLEAVARRPRARPPLRRSSARARGRSPRHTPTSEQPAGPAHARALPRGTAGRRAGGLPGAAPPARPTSSGSSRARSCATSRRRSSGRTTGLALRVPGAGAVARAAAAGRGLRGARTATPWAALGSRALVVAAASCGRARRRPPSPSRSSATSRPSRPHRTPSP